MSTSELWRWSAKDLTYGIRTRTISAREAMQACLDRAEEVNPAVNALTSIDYDGALVAADAADKAVAAGEELGPLHGVPVTTKINSDQEGESTSNGIVAFKDVVAEVDSPQVALIRRAGGIPFGRTNSPAFSYRWFSTNDLFGRTLNPWDPSRTPGGSSGGAGAAVATGMGAIAQGNDIGGSIRNPAYSCGVVGLRPTAGRVPNWYGPASQEQSLCTQLMSVDGPLARSIGDLRLAVTAMSGYYARSPLSVPARIEGTKPPRPLRVGLVRDVGVVEPDETVNQSLDQAAGWLTEAGYQVEEIDLPQLEEAYRLWWLLCLEEFRVIMPLVEEVGDDGMKRCAANYYAVAKDWWGEKPSLEEYIGGYTRRGTLIGQLHEALEAHPLVLLPTSAEPPFEQDADIDNLERARQVMAAQWPMMSIALLGFPGLAVPTGVEGLPRGVQLLGPRFGEDTLLDAGEVIEARAGTHTPIDPQP